MPARAAVLCALAGLLPGQAGFAHDVGWSPAPIGPLLQNEFVDLNGDTFLDIVRLRERAVEVLLQDPVTGRYERTTNLVFTAVTATLRSFAVGRLDASGDSVPDIAVLWSTGEVDILLSDGSGGLSRLVPRPVPALPIASGALILAADTTGDLIDDLIVFLDGVPPQYLQGVAGGTFLDITATHMPAIGYPRPKATLADIDGDTDLDMVYVSTNNLPARLFENSGGVFTDVANAFGPGGLSASAVLAIDLTGSPLPELVFGRPGTAANAPIVRLNNAGTFPTVGAVQSLRLGGVLAMAAADIDGDGFDDITVLEADGSLGFALRGNNGILIGQPIATTGNSEPIPLLSAHSGRACFSIGDLEADGDDDIAVGGDCQDSLLLHAPNHDFLDVDRLAFPTAERAATYVGAVVDRQGDGDLDFVGLCPTGEWAAFDNDGSGFYSALNAVSAALPALSNTVTWGAMAPMSLASGGRRDLLCVGFHPINGREIALLVNGGAFWLDETPLRFGGAVTGNILTVGVYPRGGGLGADDLVLGTVLGELEFHENIGGSLVHQPGAFPSNLQLWTLSQLVIADFTGDGAADVLALSSGAPPQLFLRSGGAFVHSGTAIPAGISGSAGIAAHLDGDTDNDVLLRTPGVPGVTALRWHNGSFTNVNLGALGAVNFVVEDMAVVSVDGEPRVVLARNGGNEVVMSWNGTTYVGPTTLSYRGTAATTGLLTADVDRDGDQDLLTLRQNRDPLVLANTTTHLQQLGPVQSGRAGETLLRGPAPGSLVFISFGLPLNTVTPWGLLRLDPTTMGTIFLGVAPASRESVWTLPLNPGLPHIRFPIQAAWITPTNNILLSGLELLVIAP